MLCIYVTKSWPPHFGERISCYNCYICNCFLFHCHTRPSRLQHMLVKLGSVNQDRLVDSSFAHGVSWRKQTKSGDVSCQQLTNFIHFLLRTLQSQLHQWFAPIALKITPSIQRKINIKRPLSWAPLSIRPSFRQIAWSPKPPLPCYYNHLWSNRKH